MDGLSIGRMAELNCVSTRTLRLYDEKGVLVPLHRDPDTGYRLYDLSQCATLDAIQQLQMAGFSLDEIKEQLASSDPRRLHRILSEKEDQVKAQIEELYRSQRILASTKRRCSRAINPPELNVMAIEHIPRRRAFRFDVPEEHRIAQGATSSEALLAWQLAVCDVKSTMLERGYPLSYCRNIACCIPRESLLAGQVVYTQALAFINPHDETYAAQTCLIPESDYLTMYCLDLSSDKGGLSESAGIRRMLDHIAAEGLTITGDYVGQVMLDTALFDYSGKDELVCLQIPVVRL